MALLDVTEYRELSRDNVGNLIQVAEEHGAVVNQQLAIGVGSVQSAAFGENTHFVRLHTDAACRVEFSVAPNASAASRRLAAGQTEFVGVRPGMKVAVIQTT